MVGGEKREGETKVKVYCNYPLASEMVTTVKQNFKQLYPHEEVSKKNLT